MGIWRLVLRQIVGALFMGHGSQKLFGWFEGPGLEATGKSFEQMSMRPGRQHALAASLAECGGGAAGLGALAVHAFDERLAA